MLRSLALLTVLALACGGGKKAQPPPEAPGVLAAPAALSATATLASVSLTWSAVPSANGYSVLRGIASGGPYLLAQTSTATSATDPGLDAGTTFFYVVQALNAAGTSASSNEASALTAPGAPTDLTATATGGQVLLSWTAARGATNYAIQRADLASGPYAQLTLATATSTADQTVHPGLTYWYEVRALNPAGASAGSASASASLPAPPGAPDGLVATGGKAQVQLSWIAAPDAISYAILRGEVAHGPWGPLGTSQAPQYTDTTVLAGATYYYVVEAVRAAGPGPASAEASALTIPPAPTGLVATEIGATGLLLSWNPAPGATGYSIQRNERPAGAAVTTSAQQTNLIAGTLYTWRVAATNASGLSDASAELKVPTVPASPGSVTATGADGSVSLAWPAVPGATGYDVLRSPASGGPYSAVATNQPQLSYTESSTAADYFVVLARNASGASDPSAEVSATPSSGVLAAPSLSAVSGNGVVQLDWQPIAGASGYQLFGSNTPGGYDFGAPLAAPTGTVYADTSPNGTARYYLLRAVGPGGPGPASNEVSATPVRELCVATDGPSVVALDAATSGETDVRRFFGTNTRLLAPTAVAVAGGLVAAVESNGGFVTLHSTSASGNALPSGLVAGAAAQLGQPAAVAIDPAAGELFVGIGNATGAGAVNVYSLATLALKRSITTLSPVTALLLDGSHVFAAQLNGAIQVFNTAGGAAQWSLQFANASSLSALAWDPARDELYVGANDQPATIQVIQRLDRSGTPLRAITGQGSDLPAVNGLAWDALANGGEIVASTGNRYLITYLRAATGAAAHSRRIDLGLGRALGGLSLDLAASKLWVAFSTAPVGQLEWIAQSTPTGSPGSFGIIGGPNAPDSVQPQLIAADPGNGELWFASPFAAIPTAAAYRRAPAALNPAPLRQWETAGNAVAVDSAHGVVFIGDNGNHIYALPRAAAGPATATVTLGASESSNGLWYDPAHGELVVAITDSLKGVSAIDFYPFAGSFGPSRRISGPATGLVSPYAVFVDTTHGAGLVFAANSDGSIVALPRTSTVPNAPWITRLQQSVPSLASTGQILVDGDLLYVANARGSQAGFQIAIYPYNANGALAPSRAITARGTGGGANGLAFCN